MIGPWKRKQVIGNAVLFLGDCREILPELPAVDALITDPVWPNAPKDLIPGAGDPENLFVEAMKKAPPHKRCAIHMGCNSNPGMLSCIKLPFFRVMWLEYIRPHYLGRLLYTSDVAYLYGEPPPSRPGNRVISGYNRITDSRREKNNHPCPRQTSHLNFIITKWTNEGERILDPFMGSATTGVACMNLGRKFVGIEVDDAFFTNACERIHEAWTSRPRLFEEEKKPEQVSLVNREGK